MRRVRAGWWFLRRSPALPLNAPATSALPRSMAVGIRRQADMDVFTTCPRNHYPTLMIRQFLLLLPWDALKARLEAEDIVWALCHDVVPGLQDLVGNGAVGNV